MCSPRPVTVILFPLACVNLRPHSPLSPDCGASCGEAVASEASAFVPAIVVHVKSSAEQMKSQPQLSRVPLTHVVVPPARYKFGYLPARLPCTLLFSCVLSHSSRHMLLRGVCEAGHDDLPRIAHGALPWVGSCSTRCLGALQPVFGYAA